ncbi:MAG: hypothetical protein U1F35_21150 [Steroidobacteraceae bacterium]
MRLIADCLGKPARLLDVPPWLIRRMARLVGRAEAAERLCGSLAVDISETRSQLGWSPPMSDREQMQVTAQWYRQAAGGIAHMKLLPPWRCPRCVPSSRRRARTPDPVGVAVLADRCPE